MTESREKRKWKIGKLTQLIGTLVSACPAVKYGWLYTKRLERDKYLGLKKSGGNFNSKTVLSDEALEDLKWWIQNIRSSTNPIREENYAMEIFTDASLTGWGAFCNGEKIHGWWDLDEQNNYINYLELKAAFFGLKCFAKSHKNCEIILRMDNKTGISYINRMGSIQYPNLTQLSRKIWQWCEKRGIWIHASYLKSKENVEADEQSRGMPRETEWELADWAFQKIIENIGIIEIDLFASRTNTKCKKFVSWHRDPNSFAIDAFTINWSGHFFYAFPPFSLMLRVLRKIQIEKAEGVVVAPFWPTQPWYPVFTSLMVSEPLIFKPNRKFLFCLYRETHPLSATLVLIAGRLSGKVLKQEEHQKRPRQ